MTPQERDIERALVGMVKHHGGLCLKWVCPGWSGVPDRIVLMPYGHIAFVETKRPKGGEVRKLQTWWHQKLRSIGFAVLVVRDKQDIDLLEDALMRM